MRKFYKFTKTTAEERLKELEEFVDKYNSKYKSYNAVIDWLNRIVSFNIVNGDGFEFEDPDTCLEDWLWGHGGIAKYSPSAHIVVNDNIDLGKL